MLWPSWPRAHRSRQRGTELRATARWLRHARHPPQRYHSREQPTACCRHVGYTEMNSLMGGLSAETCVVVQVRAALWQHHHQSWGALGAGLGNRQGAHLMGEWPLLPVPRCAGVLTTVEQTAAPSSCFLTHSQRRLTNLEVPSINADGVVGHISEVRAGTWWTWKAKGWCEPCVSSAGRVAGGGPMPQKGGWLHCEVEDRDPRASSVPAVPCTQRGKRWSAAPPAPALPHG